MKNLWRRLHLAGSQEEHSDSAHPKAPKTRFSFSDSLAPSASASDSKPFPGLSGLISVAKNTLHQTGSLKQKKDGSLSVDREQKEQRNEGSVEKQQRDLESSIIADSTCVSDHRDKGVGDRITDDNDMHFEVSSAVLPSAAASAGATEHRSPGSIVAESRGSPLSMDTISKGPPGLARAETAETAALQRASNQALLLQDEELQVRVAMALSARDDPEAATIETMKDVSLGSDPLLSNSSAHLLAYRYWVSQRESIEIPQIYNFSFLYSYKRLY